MYFRSSKKNRSYVRKDFLSVDELSIQLIVRTFFQHADRIFRRSFHILAVSRRWIILEDKITKDIKELRRNEKNIETNRSIVVVTSRKNQT